MCECNQQTELCNGRPHTKNRSGETRKALRKALSVDEHDHVAKLLADQWHVCRRFEKWTKCGSGCGKEKQEFKDEMARVDYEVRPEEAGPLIQKIVQKFYDKGLFWNTNGARCWEQNFLRHLKTGCIAARVEVSRSAMAWLVGGEQELQRVVALQAARAAAPGGELRDPTVSFSADSASCVLALPCGSRGTNVCESSFMTRRCFLQRHLGNATLGLYEATGLAHYAAINEKKAAKELRLQGKLSERQLREAGLAPRYKAGSSSNAFGATRRAEEEAAAAGLPNLFSRYVLASRERVRRATPAEYLVLQRRYASSVASRLFCRYIRICGQSGVLAREYFSRHAKTCNPEALGTKHAHAAAERAALAEAKRAAAEKRRAGATAADGSSGSSSDESPPPPAKVRCKVCTRFCIHPLSCEATVATVVARVARTVPPLAK